MDVTPLPNNAGLPRRLLGMFCSMIVRGPYVTSLTPNGSYPLTSIINFQEITLYSKGLESAHRVAKTIVVFLTQRYFHPHTEFQLANYGNRSGKTKAAKSSNEVEYRAILDNLISDLLTVLYLPEWPAAGLLLGVVTRLFVSRSRELCAQTNISSLKGRISR
jgi:hypothetical protein